MRFAMILAMGLLGAGCAGDQIAATPPRGVDLSGHWKLNEADSDDPLRLMQTQLSNATAGAGAGGQQPTSGGRGGRGGRGPGPSGPDGPMMPSVTMLDEALRWPGRDLTLKQVSGVVTFSVDGHPRTCRYRGAGAHHDVPKGPPGSGPGPGGAPSSGGDPRAQDAPRDPHAQGGDPRAHDAPGHGRGDAPPPVCGWDEKTLVVQTAEPDDDRPPFDLRFNVSDDGARLIEVVDFKGGRSRGFTASRVWDRLP